MWSKIISTNDIMLQTTIEHHTGFDTPTEVWIKGKKGHDFKRGDVIIILSESTFTYKIDKLKYTLEWCEGNFKLRPFDDKYRKCIIPEGFVHAKKMNVLVINKESTEEYYHIIELVNTNTSTIDNS